MDYVYGSKKTPEGDVEILETIGDTHSNLTGRNTITRHYDDRNITDTFVVDRRYRTITADDGTCYDWYYIKDHSRDTDWYKPGIVKTEQEITDQHLALMEAEQTITDLDIRVMELEMREG